MKTPKRLKPKVVVREDSPHQSTRSAGVPLNLIVIHSTESHNRPGAGDLEATGNWFSNPAAQASAHVCVDADGLSARFVPDRRKAWHCAAYNSASLGIEQIGFAAQGWRAWRGNEAELLETARWLADWSLKHDIPLRRALVRSGSVLRSGVTTHKKLGVLGGDHSDPGSYPMRWVLRHARKIRRARKRQAA